MRRGLPAGRVRVAAPGARLERRVPKEVHDGVHPREGRVEKERVKEKKKEGEEFGVELEEEEEKGFFFFFLAPPPSLSLSLSLRPFRGLSLFFLIFRVFVSLFPSVCVC